MARFRGKPSPFQFQFQQLQPQLQPQLQLPLPLPAAQSIAQFLLYILPAFISGRGLSNITPLL